MGEAGTLRSAIQAEAAENQWHQPFPSSAWADVYTRWGATVMVEWGKRDLLSQLRWSDGCGDYEVVTGTRRELQQEVLARLRQPASTHWAKLTARSLVPVGPVIDHIKRLRAAGMTNREIAAAAGISYNTFNSLFYVTNGRTDAPKTHVTVATFIAIMSVRVPTKELASA